MQQSRVTIVGGGIPGLSLALMLARESIHVTVVDKAKLPDKQSVTPSSRTAALMQSSLAVFDRIGLLDEMKRISTPLCQLSIIDDSAFPQGGEAMVREDFKAEELGLSEFGYNVPLNEVMALLVEHVLSNDNITVLDKTEIDCHHDLIQKADLIVGADGRNSVVRQWHDIDVHAHDYGQSAITCVVSHTQPHAYTSTEFHRSGGPCTFVPHGDNQSAVVWVEKTDDAEAFLKLSSNEFIAALHERSRGLLGQIDLAVEPSSWPLMALKADRMIAPKTALIAEAAHVVSPIGAQGLNMSLRDVAALADYVLAAQEKGDEVGSINVLKRYERHRLRDIAPRLRGIDLFNRLVANDNIVARGLRRLGLRAIRHAGPLRQFLMQEGLSPR